MKYLILFFFLTACNVKPPILKDPSPAKESKLAWQNPEWDRALYAAIESSGIYKIKPKDFDQWCKQDKDLKDFYAELFVSIAKAESGFNPRAKYVENFKDAKGGAVLSSGLFQLSVESANAKRYACGVTQDDLFDPITNIRCAVKIAKYWIEDDGVISSDTNLGAARYWSVLRPKSSAFLAVKARVCK